MEVVGVVGDVHGGGIDKGSSIEVYYPEKLFPQSQPTLVAHTETEPMALAPMIRSAILDSDPDAHISEVKTMESVILDSVAERLFGLRLIGALSIAGFVLAGFGIVITTMHSIACRASELRIRVACGATPWDIIALVLTQQGKQIIAAIAAAILLGFLVVPSLNLPWQDAQFFRSLALWVVPAVLSAAAILFLLFFLRL